MRSYKAYGQVQNNIRAWCTLRTWDWYLLFGKIRPMLGQTQREIEKMKARIVEVEELLVVEEKNREKAQEVKAQPVRAPRPRHRRRRGRPPGPGGKERGVHPSHQRSGR